MDHQTLIFELSSDEEIGFDNSSSADNFDWITKLLKDDAPNDDENRKNFNFVSFDDYNYNINSNYEDTNDINGGRKVEDDDDDVVVVGEVFAKPKRVKRSFEAEKKGGSCDGDDDDCVILDCDPDKKPPEKPPENDDPKVFEEDADELVVVGEKGQVACRDFPHSRHLCANFPFSSTPHASRCDQCHCYVCDSLAPCVYWGSGVSSSDHCHATDKVEYWQLERKRLRELKNPPLPTVSQSPKLIQATARLNMNPHIDPACAVSMPHGIPNFINRSRSERICQQQLIPRVRTLSSNTQGHQGSYVSHRGAPSRPMFKRSGLAVRSGLASRTALCSPNSVYVGALSQQMVGKPVESISSNLRDSSQGLAINPSFYQPSTRSTSNKTPLQGSYGLPNPHTPTSRFQGGGRSAAVMSDHPYKYTSVNQTESVISPLIPCNPSSVLNSVSQSSQQSTLIQVPSPNITQRSLQPLAVTPNCSSMSSQSGSSIVTNSFSHICQQPVPMNSMDQAMNSMDQAAMPISQPLQSLEQDLSLDFDVDSWLAENDSDGTFFGINCQPALADPVDADMLYFDFESSWKGLTRS